MPAILFEEMDSFNVKNVYDNNIIKRVAGHTLLDRKEMRGILS